MTVPRARAALHGLLRSGPAAAGAAVLVALGLAGGAWPLFEVPGLELGLAVALAFALGLGPALGVAAARRELAARSPAVPGVLRPAAAAAGVAAGLVALAGGAAALRAAVATPCRPLTAAPLFLLVAAPSALLATSLGVAAGLATGGRAGRAALAYGAAALASLASTLLVAYLGPSASAHDHLLGVWPGPLYDEVIPIDARLVLFRAGTLAWAASALAAAALLVRRRARAPSARPAAALALGVAAAAAAWVAGGGEPTRGDLDRALGAVREGPRCVVHLPREKGPSAAERALRDCEYDAQEVAAALGLARPPRATVWIHRSAAERRRLVGAAGTSFTKPWLAEIHLVDEGVPHPLLRHELVHALASAAARGPLRVPARFGVLVDAGLLEGLAVALEVPAGSFGVHAWARAMRDQGRLPTMAALLRPEGFLGAPPARAYTAAGSFLRFLLERHGQGPVLAAYATDDLAGALGRPVAELEAAWQRFLDGVAVPPALAAAAEARFARGSLFARACAREVAQLEVDAARDAGAGRAAAAERLLRRARELSGGDPAWLAGAADAWRAAGDLARAEAILGEALAAAEAAGGRHALRAALLGSLGDLRLRAGDLSGAAERYRAAVPLAAAGAEERLAQAKLAAASDPALADAVGPWLARIGDPNAALSRVARSGAPLARYLLARARLGRGAPALALEDLAGLAPAGLPGPAFAREARRLEAEALCLVGRYAEGIAAFRALAAPPAHEGDRERALDDAGRCAFERDAYGAPVRWGG